MRNAILFRAEDPYNLHQVTPPTFSNVGVERIKGSRYPSPGSRGVEVSVPVKRDMNEDDIYHNNYFIRDPRNMKRNVRLLPFFASVNWARPLAALYTLPATSLFCSDRDT